LIALAIAVVCATATPRPCPTDLPAPNLGVADPFRPPDPRATELNAAGKVLYRQGQWDAARAKYRAAEAADADFLAPRLNIACSFVRQERFAEAAAEVVALIERAYLPWSREVLEAADLGALKVRPEMQPIKRAMADAGAKWGAGLGDALVFVGRARPPLRVPADGQGVFILNPHQEVYAFLPSTNRFRQLTAEDGHVVAAARSLDGRRVAYVVAEQLVRGPRPGEVVLDRVAIGELTLATMSPAPLVPIDGRVRRIAIAARGGGFVYGIDSEHARGWFRVSDGQRLVTTGGAGGEAEAVTLSARGTDAIERAVRTGCSGRARDQSPGSVARSVALELRGRPPRTIGGRFGAGLAGLPLP
jgi:hypothetical protein